MSLSALYNVQCSINVGTCMFKTFKNIFKYYCYLTGVCILNLFISLDTYI